MLKKVSFPFFLTGEKTRIAVITNFTIVIITPIFGQYVVCHVILFNETNDWVVGLGRFGLVSLVKMAYTGSWAVKQEETSELLVFVDFLQIEVSSYEQPHE